MRRAIIGLLLFASVSSAAACAKSTDAASNASSTLSRRSDRSTTSSTTSLTTTSSTITTSTTATAPSAPSAPDPQAKVITTANGVVVPVLEVTANGYRVRTPCGRDAFVAYGEPSRSATVVLDPGHGGVETGAVGANGLVERDLNLEVTRRLADLLKADGISVALTRTGDYRVTIATRAEIAVALSPKAFVSVHHNGGSDGPSSKPGTETFFQIGSGDSKRLAGLIYEELLTTFSITRDVAWQADTDAGAKYRPNDSGGDYYGILRRSKAVPAVLSEALFLSNPPEAELLAKAQTQRSEAEALARAIKRFLNSDDPGSGFTEPYPRSEPAGPGGGSDNCVDPALS